MIDVYQREVLSSGEIVHLYHDEQDRQAGFTLVVIPLEIWMQPESIIRNGSRSECLAALTRLLAADVCETA
tara:strand:+ start:278 stop:490 length:213 start_codon:yes stop_codon:yes gene_type:complete